MERDRGRTDRKLCGHAASLCVFRFFYLLPPERDGLKRITTHAFSVMGSDTSAKSFTRRSSEPGPVMKVRLRSRKPHKNSRYLRWVLLVTRLCFLGETSREDARAQCAPAVRCVCVSSGPLAAFSLRPYRDPSVLGGGDFFLRF